ncbi:MAG TPA: alpha/beta fold hydrolase [Polyangiaceae bacterium]|nr:alpha/beta fold hydrolase [Polyangiaceae bacterium]
MLLFAVGTLLLAAPAYWARRAYRIERASFIPRRHPPRVSLAEVGIESAREVTFQAGPGLKLKGYYVPSRNGAALAVTHGAGGERSDVLSELRILAGAGFGVLAFDWPGHGESEGDIVWGAPERSALVAALDFLCAQPEVDRSRLGAFGFSMGGYIVTQVAALDTRLRAVAMAGSPHDAKEHIMWEYRRFRVLTQWPALLAVRVSGMQVSEMVPEQVIGKISPRPILLIQGTEDQLVPSWITERLYAAAGEPKRLLRVHGAAHGGYDQADPAGYARALLEFFSVLSAAAAP